MACVKVLTFFAFLTLLCVVNSSKLIYRRYEKKHPKKNYVQVVEIFGTRQEPPHYTKSDKELNNFLARDSYKTDMNCTKSNKTKSDEVTTNKVTTTTALPVTIPVTFSTIPTTAFRITTTSPPIEKPPTTTTKSTPIRTPNLNELFTIRPTKPTIKPNPRENNNPDYTNVIPWPNVQVTKHPPSTKTPTIVIQETDDQPANNRTTLGDIDNEFRRTQKPSTTTTRKSSSVESVDDGIYYKTDEEKEEDYNGNEYNEDNYTDTISPNEFELTTEEGAAEYSDNENDSDNENEYDEDEGELQKRRKRQKAKSVTTLKRKHTTKT